MPKNMAYSRYIAVNHMEKPHCCIVLIATRTRPEITVVGNQTDSLTQPRPQAPHLFRKTAKCRRPQPSKVLGERDEFRDMRCLPANGNVPAQ